MDRENFSKMNFKVIDVPAGDPLEFYKGSQWNLVYYVMLLYGALFGVSFFRIFGLPWYTFRTLVFALVVFDFGIYMVVELQYKLQQTRIMRLHTRIGIDSFTIG